MADSKSRKKSSQPIGRRAPARQKAVSPPERSLRGREAAIAARERGPAGNHVPERESAVAAREEAVLTRSSAGGLRESAVRAREEAARLREEAVHARKEATRVKSELEQLMGQMRDANQRLVIATVRAQTLTEEAEQANRLKDEFVAMVSHELRTPLNAVLGWARMLASKQLNRERSAHAIAAIERNASALAHIIDDLLDVSRIMAGTLHLVYQPVDLVATVQAALDTVRSLAAAKNIHLRFSSDPSSTELVSGDPSRLQQVVLNLLSNAIKFTPEDGRIDVSITRAGSNLEIVVKDTGEGISPVFVPHVFDRFRQAQGATTRRHTGLGLGLAIVRQLVELHGGTVAADSPGPGKGATFTVCLPIMASPPVIERRSPGPDRSAPPLERLDGLHILLVEDHADGREVMEALLEEAGARVTTSSSAREALRVLETQQPDALVSDIGLPDEDGYALIRRLRKREAKGGGFLPAVAVTGYVRAEDRARILAAGFQAHVPKPVEPIELRAAIAAVARDPRRRESQPRTAP